MSCWGLLVVGLISTAIAAWTPTSSAGATAGGLQFLSMLLFFIVHATLTGGWRVPIAFFLIVGLTSFSLEAVSISTGFPFGYFEHFTPGPRFLGVPMAVPVGYVVFAWFAWTQAQVLFRMVGGKQGTDLIMIVPVIATFLLVGYDYPWDAIGANVMRTHAYKDPSGLFGVPLTNFLGWMLTGWIAFLLFALSQRKSIAAQPIQPRALEVVPPIFWIVIALGYFIRYLATPAGLVKVGDSSFVIKDIAEAAAAISIPAMIFPSIMVLLAAIRVADTASSSDS